MSSVAIIGEARGAVSSLTEYLGPASVTRVDGPEVFVELPSGAAARVDLAFTFPYAPAVGDMLLVIGRAEAHYAIGVLQGTGRTTLTFPGDVELRAEGGSLRLWGEKGIELLGPGLTVQVDKLRVIADAVTQKLGSLTQRVQGLLRVHAKDVSTLADESVTTQAKTASVITQETVTINGKEVHLG